MNQCFRHHASAGWTRRRRPPALLQCMLGDERTEGCRVRVDLEAGVKRRRIFCCVTRTWRDSAPLCVCQTDVKHKIRAEISKKSLVKSVSVDSESVSVDSESISVSLTFQTLSPDPRLSGCQH